MATKKPSLQKLPAWEVTTREQASAGITLIGYLTRALAQLEIDMNAEIAQITERFQENINIKKAEIKQAIAGVSVYCRKNRDALTDKGKTKTIDLITGKVSWRFNPNSIGKIENMDTVLAHIKAQNLTQFIKFQEVLDKEALLKSPLIAATIPGIKVVIGKEVISIEPNNVKVGQ